MSTAELNADLTVGLITHHFGANLAASMNPSTKPLGISAYWTMTTVLPCKSAKNANDGFFNYHAQVCIVEDHKRCDDIILIETYLRCYPPE